MRVNRGNLTGFCTSGLALGFRVCLILVMSWGIVVAFAAFWVAYAKSPLAPLEFKPNMAPEEKIEKLFEIRSRQIPLLEKFLQKYPQSPRVPDSLFQLGEAHFEVGKYYQAKGNEKQADAEIRRSLAVLEKVRASFPSYKHLDEAMFVLANTYIETQQMSKAGAVLADISNRFPHSPVLKEASLLLGDYYFTKNENARAESYYNVALGDPKNQSYVYYKLAWTSMNQNQPARALQYFEKVIQMHASNPDSASYFRDAAREMILAAYQVYSAKKVLPYFERILQDPELVQSSTSSLAKALVDKSQFADASYLYESLQSRYPDSPRQAEWIQNEIKAEESLGRTTKVVKLVARLNTNDASAPQVEAYVLNSAKKFHAEAKKEKNLQTQAHDYDVAAGYYRAYLQKANPEDAQTAEISFLLGEVLYARDRFADASNAYETASRVQGKHQAQAVWAWFLSEEHLAEGFRHSGSSAANAGPHDLRYLEAARALQSVPGITLAQKRKASYQTARLLYQMNDTEHSLPVFQFLAQNQSHTEEGRLSAQLVLDIYNLRKDYRSVAEYARAYRAHASSGEEKKELSELEEQASLKALAQEEADAKTKYGDEKNTSLAEVARRYYQFGKAYPHSKFAEATLWAAVQDFAVVAAEKNDKDIGELRASFGLLVTRYSSSPKAKAAIELMAKFLSLQKVDALALKDFAPYRHQWLKAMSEEPRGRRGRLGMLIYRLSDDSQKRALVHEFASLPLTEENREAYAYGRLISIRELKQKMESITLRSSLGLAKKTQEKIKILEHIQREVTSLAKLKAPEPAIEGLQLLADSYLNMAEAVRSAPVPTQLKGADRAKYEAAISEKAKVFEDKGNEARNLANEKASELKLS